MVRPVADARRAAAALAAALWALLPVAAPAQQAPLSASDWLSGSVQAPPRASSGWRPGTPRPPDAGAAPAVTPRAPIPPVAATGAVGKVKVSRLDDGDPDAAGTISAGNAGLPVDLWAGSDAADLSRRIAEAPARLPAMTALLRRVLTAQLTPTGSDDASRGRMFLARADRLLDMGDTAAARALLTQAGPGQPELFRRLFDIALLEGDEARACEAMGHTPGIAPSFAARIFCLAQSGDWAAAAIVFHGADDLGLLDPDRAALLRHFLDDAYVDSDEPLTPPNPVTPLDFRMHEAVGQPLPTAPLPLAFAHSDLRANSGWKARLEAAERLARAGAIPAADMRRIYAEQQPAASGGVWDRAAAMQRLESALTGGGDLTQPLTEALRVFSVVGMGGVLAAMLDPDLARLPAGDTATALTRWQRGTTAAADPADLPPPPETRKGEALLAAMADVDAGLDGDEARAARGLAMLRAMGLGTDADLAAAQLTLAPVLLLPR